MTFYLIWNGEIIDETEDRQDADYLRGEYTLAYGGSVRIADENDREVQRIQQEDQ